MSKLRGTMSKLTSKKSRKWTILALVAVALIVFFGYRYWRGRQSALPAGIASGNGRLEAKEVDVASKLPLKVEKVLVAEGDLVKPGQVLVQMDTVTLKAELAEANESVAAAREQVAVAEAELARRKSEINLARIEKERSRKLVEQRAGSQRELDVRTSSLETSMAGFAESRAKQEAAEKQVAVAQANVATIQSRIDDATLTSPVLGRVLYRLAEPGEVLGPGGKALTLINLKDVYMEIFLPSQQAGSVKIGSEARFTVDYAPDRVGVGTVSFVSPEAQFTPKEVETRTEREKLVFRVKIQVPEELITRHIQQFKTGVRGVGYVKLREDAVWPDWLQKNLVRPSEPAPPAPAVSSTGSTGSGSAE